MKQSVEEVFEGCGLSVASRTGLHLKCLLGRDHEGDCVPELPSPRGSVFEKWVATREHEFVGHLLSIVESAGDTLTFAEAFNIASCLCRERLGMPERQP